MKSELNLKKVKWNELNYNLTSNHLFSKNDVIDIKMNLKKLYSVRNVCIITI